jgi:hypothetical protein
MLRSRFHIAALLLLLWNWSNAQQYINYNISDGLPSNNVYRMTQDNQGFIWVITDKGMAKFDGKVFKTFTTRNGLPTNDIWDITVTPDNRVWYFTKSAVLGYIENDEVYQLKTCTENKTMYPSTTLQIGDQIALGQNSWFYFGDGCWQDFTETALDENATIIQNNPLLAGMNPLSNEQKELAFGSVMRTIKEARDSTRFYHVTRTKDSLCGMLYSNGYTLVNLKNGLVIDREFRNIFSKDHPDFTRIHFLNDEIQITGFNFVSKLDENYKMRSVVQIPEKLQSYFSMIDRSGNIWSATFTNGIYMLPQAKRNIVYDLEFDKVDKIAKSGDKIIANVYDKGFYEYDSSRKKFIPYIQKNGFIFSADFIDSLNIHLYTTQHQTIGVFENKHKVLFSNSGLGIRKLVYLNERLYGNNSAGLVELDKTSFKKTSLFDQVGITDLLVLDNGILLATSTGLKYFSHNSIDPVNAGDKNLQNPMLNLARLDDTRVVIGTDGFGAYISDLKTSKLLAGTEFLSIEDIYIENETIWLATEQGILKYIKKDTGFELISVFDESDGLPSRKVNSVSIINDSIFASTDNGIAIFHKDKKKQSQLLDIFINEAGYNDEPILKTKRVFPYKNKSTVFIEVSSIDFTEGNRSPVSYQYRLLPVQAEWVETSSPAIDFTSLSPDDYQFQIKYGEQIKSLNFIILPLWWQRTGVQLFLVICTVLIAGFVLLRIRKHELAKRMAKVLTEKKMAEFELYALRSQMNPHFVFNSLAAIQYYINNNDIETSEAYLVRFSRLIRQYFEFSKETEISLLKECELLENYLIIEKLRFKDRLNYAITIDPKIDPESVSIPVMLLQPIVENAVNHGIFNKVGPGKICVNFIQNTENAITVEITDDGIGFKAENTEKTAKVNSSQIIEERIYHLNRSGNWDISWSVKSLYNEGDERGACVRFRIQKIK